MTFENSLYTYQPNHVLPMLFAVLIGVSFVGHIYQNFRYKYWRVTFFMFWGGAVFTTGWILRAVSVHDQKNLGLYIAQTVCIYAGPPIYSAAEYNVLGRLMHYLPMHSPLNPGRILYFFLYLGIVVESLTAAGAARSATGADNPDVFKSGGILVSTGLVLQAIVELTFISTVAYLHYRCKTASMLSPNIRSVFIMLYGTSLLIIFRCIFRAVEAFSTYTINYYQDPDACTSLCRAFLDHEWYIYAFEAAPMVLYTYWLNIIHPGRLLPQSTKRYLDLDGQTERWGPGWIEKRSLWMTFVDPFDMRNRAKGKTAHEKFWLEPERWPVCEDGSFAQGTASNVGRRREEDPEIAKLQERRRYKMSL